MPIQSGNQRGFTLIELMIVLGIVAFLMVVALPAYQEQVLKTKRNIGKGELMELAARQEQFFVNNRQYASNLANLGYTDGADGFEIDSDGDPVADGNSNSIYLITLSLVTTTSYTALATRLNAQVKDDYCGDLTYNSAGEGGADNNVEYCW